MATTPNQLSDMLARSAEGDRAAFAALYAATSSKLYGIVLRILKRRDIADEILQEAYINIWRNAARFDRSQASPITWMATIARNRALDEVRRRSPIQLDDAPGALEIADEAPLPGDNLLQSEFLHQLTGCLDELDELKREVVKLAYLEGLSRQDLAERFQQPLGTIKTWLHRSLRQLKDCLGS